MVTRRLLSAVRSFSRLDPPINCPIQFKRRHASVGPISCSEEAKELNFLRNVALIAHIDAGKTTTTERMLYASGTTKNMGNVDEGTTVCDFMVQERERGITIAAAAVCFDWNCNRINLIDTPGHVDFTIEVEKSLRVVDGALIILDASAGVEVQTLAVWNQAVNFKLPALVFLNKIDKHGANIDNCLSSIREKMSITPLLLSYPLLDEGGNVCGYVDLTGMTAFKWNYGEDGESKHASGMVLKEELARKAESFREDLIGQLAELDEEIADEIISNDVPVSAGTIKQCISRVTEKRLVLPVLFGSAQRNQGVHTLLDAICHYLPSPVANNSRVSGFYSRSLCCLAFKIMHDRYLGCLTFVRIYKGKLVTNTKVYNVNRDCAEIVSKIFIPFGHTMNSVSCAGPGQIVAITGLQETCTGDTLTDKLSSVETSHSKGKSSYSPADRQKLLLAGVSLPDPVYKCVIEPSTVGYQSKLDNALKELVREDPSLRIYIDEDSQETVLEGMGELHIDIVKDRLLREYGLEVFLGPLQINYHETATKTVQFEHHLKQMISGRQKAVSVKLTVGPCPGEGPLKGLQIAHFQGEKFLEDRFPEHVLQSVRNGCLNAAVHGPLLSARVQDVFVRLEDIDVDQGTPLATVAACANQCFVEAIRKASPILLEPVIELVVTVPEEHSHGVLSDLACRGSHVLNFELSEGQLNCIHAVAPLSKMADYATALRTLTSGTGSFRISFVRYEPLSAEKTAEVIRKYENSFD
ncbi:ribosome releasing factor 2, mitochondrial [Trichuris trichiura]|uniref:Ribosome releasing factor 2, mitochondrial n=1 Tax=Trichuris trichiura TaxID=36087 RepID=A0A077ZL28_TRITR|nr:ribosome releasing factor 2, mitochondrial [Trichuris trichiura]